MTVTAKKQIPAFSSQQIEGLCKSLGDTSDGLKGSEIGHLLRECGMADPTPSLTKWQRLYNAFGEDQNQSRIGTHIMQFIVKAMNPARYTTEPVLHRTRLDRINTVLAFSGYAITEQGKVQATEAVGTIGEALDRANRLHAALIQRAVHADVLRFCKPEILQQNFFHAVFEAMKSITSKIRGLSGTTGDGVDLVHAAFGMRDGPPPEEDERVEAEFLVVPVGADEDPLPVHPAVGDHRRPLQLIVSKQVHPRPFLGEEDPTAATVPHSRLERMVTSSEASSIPRRAWVSLAVR